MYISKQAKDPMMDYGAHAIILWVQCKQPLTGTNSLPVLLNNISSYLFQWLNAAHTDISQFFQL